MKYAKVVGSLLLIATNLSSVSSYAAPIYYECNLLVIQQKYEKALEVCEPFARTGLVWAQELLGSLYGNVGINIPSILSYPESLKWYLAAAEQGSPSAQVHVSDYYRDGLGASQNYMEAARWAAEAATQNYEAAFPRVAHFYLKGLGVDRDQSIAFEWFKRGAESGDTYSMVQLSRILLHPGSRSPIAPDREKAEYWLRKASFEGDDPSAKVDLTYMLIARDESDRNFQEEYELLESAANQGYTVAQFRLGEKLLSKIWGAENPTKAREWLIRATQNLSARAPALLSTMYERGIGVKENPLQAYAWLLISQQNAIADSNRAKSTSAVILKLDERLQNMRLVLSENELEQAKALASVYTKKNFNVE